VSEINDCDFGPCPKCGNTIHDHALSCPHCKAHLFQGNDEAKRPVLLPPDFWTASTSQDEPLLDPCPVCERPISVSAMTCPHCRCDFLTFRQAGLKKGKTRLESSWVWNGSVADFVRRRIRGRSLNVCAGLSELGDVKVDLDPKDRKAIRGDVSNLPFPDNSFDTVICDPPWRIGYHQRWKPFFELVRVCKVGGRIIHNAYWLPDSALVRLVETAVRADSAFTNTSVIAVFEKKQATR
jgi:Double zinc ribbon/Methyltransferase domain